jgi:cobalt-zinc-cadmium efflux system outer membrane protein
MSSSSRTGWRTAVHAVQAARQQLAIAQRSLEAFATGRETADALLAAGNITPLEAASQIADYERARITVAELELALADRTERVQTLLGLHGESLDWTIAHDLAPAPTSPPTIDALEARAVRASLDLDANRSRQTAAARRMRLARVDGWLPDIDVDVHGLYASEREPGQGDPWRFGGGVSISVPLFDRGRGTVASRRAEHSALVQRREGLAIDLRSAARSIRNRLTSAHARARQLEQVILPAQRTVTEQTVLQYHAMQVGLFAVLQAKRDELALELAYVETLREYWDATASLAALTAGRAVELGVPARLRNEENASSDGEH